MITEPSDTHPPVPFRERLTPPRLLAVSFLGLILLGTLGLKLLPGLYTGDGLSWLDSLFTATSAVCVTGLIVVDTATYFTVWGQAFLLLLIQLGGLGILTFATLAILALGGRLSLHQEALTSPVLEVVPELDGGRMVRNLILFTFAVEAAGALILFLVWWGGSGPENAAWHAIFQSVSAFCNAGFSTFSDSLTGFRTSWVTLSVMMVLIVSGGIGFLTLEELRLLWKKKRGRLFSRLSLHSRLVLVTTAVLLVGGCGLYAFLEWTNALAGLHPAERWLNAMFMSVTARTAGFNTVDYGATADSTNFLTILLMSIGGSPGSTAGGLKTTTFALIGLLALARLRGGLVAGAWGKSVPEETVQRAVGLFVLAFGAVTAGVLLISVIEIGGVGHHLAPGSLVQHMFEMVSAFNTVGLSMGVTSELDPGGKGLTILLMFLGRVGPLTLATALARPTTNGSGRFRYSYEDVILG